jgi:DNA-3-methyladenine glycosylase II
MLTKPQKILADSDSKLAKIITTIPEPTFQSTQDVFFDLMSCIIEQQVHYRSTKKIFQKLLDKAGLTHLNSDNFALLEEKSLPEIKLSLAKYETLARVLSFWQNNQIHWQTLADAEVRATLSQIKGLGHWTIDMILLFTLERPNIFPADDFHLKQIMVDLYQLNPSSKLRAQMLAIAQLWGEQKSLAVKYLWAWKNFQKSPKHSEFI